jgi:hypothetical protein
MSFVTVHQITSKDKGEAFLNVEENFGHVKVWGSRHGSKTILALLDNSIFELIQFDDIEYYDEWMKENKERYQSLTEIGL